MRKNMRIQPINNGRVLAKRGNKWKWASFVAFGVPIEEREMETLLLLEAMIIFFLYVAKDRCYGVIKSLDIEFGNP